MKRTSAIFVYALVAFACVWAGDLTITESVPLDTVYGQPFARETRSAWLEMINSAQKTLDIETFYISDDGGDTLNPVIDAIKTAGRRGVKVRIIADGEFYKQYGKLPDALGKEKNIETRIINFGAINGGIMHAKYFVADGRDMFVGSSNFDWKSLTHIHEIGARIKNSAVSEGFLDLFNCDWEYAKTGGKYNCRAKNLVNEKTPEEIIFEGEKHFIYPAFSPQKYIPDNAENELTQILNIFKTAKEYISVQVMTYKIKARDKTYWRVLDNAIRQAGKRGVKVNLIFANWSMRGKDTRDVRRLAKAKNISVKIITVPPYRDEDIKYARVDHSKYITADGKISLISTSNWQKDYFTASRGAAIIVKGKKFAEAVNAVFQTSQNSPYAKKL